MINYNNNNNNNNNNEKVWLILYGNISYVLSYINDYFQIPTFLIYEHSSR